MLVSACTQQQSPTLQQVKDLCLDVLEGVFRNIPHMSSHEDSLRQAETMEEIMRIVCFRMSNWISYDFLRTLIAEFQPALQNVAEKLVDYEKQLKPLLLQKLGHIAELQQR